MRGKEANSNLRRTTIPGTVKLRESPGERGFFQFDYEHTQLKTSVDPLETQLAASRVAAANLLEALVTELSTRAHIDHLRAMLN